MKRKRVYRRRPWRRTQVVIDRRMREVFADGFGLLPYGATYKQVKATRLALTRLVDDDGYWQGLHELYEQKRKITALIESLKLGTSNGKGAADHSTPEAKAKKGKR